MNATISKKNTTYSVFIHILVWLFAFGTPFLFMDRSNGFSYSFFWKTVSSMLFCMIIFYINYFYLIDNLLFKKRTREFIIINVLLIVAISVTSHYIYDWINALQLDGPRRRRNRMAPRAMFFIIRDFLTLMLVAGSSVAIKMSNRWFSMETERQRLKKEIAEAELQNLKNQISPHFLLNTLNNIYALIEFNPHKAQEAVQDLAKLLRHLLYDNNHQVVPLTQEVDFIQNYIDLMRMRLSENVRFDIDIHLQPHSEIKIVPLIFISLIENAFKHGVSATKPSFIRIQITETETGDIHFVCANTDFPKTAADKSGKGIGLQQVQKRLDLFYPKRYTWNKIVEKGVYTTTLHIQTKPQ